MRILPILFLTLFLFQSCTNQTDKNSIEKYLDNSIKVDSLNVPIDMNQGYFPLNKFTDTSIYVGYDTFHVEWYSKHLIAMEEPLIFNKKQNKSIFRFLWLRSFHNPIAIRIEKQSDTYLLTWKLCNGAGGYEPKKMIVNKTKTINKETWDSFQDLLLKVDYWNLKTNEVEIPGSDGSQWILEGTDEKNYHVVDRWTPRGGIFYDCCNFLIELTDLEFKEDEKY
ncbi:MAG TPA: hypothetical protein DHV48_10645 [Prolixibacteraceae bacterium]|nr:hypothetical protein [Prolixibacteraceae bacterium]